MVPPNAAKQLPPVLLARMLLTSVTAMPLPGLVTMPVLKMAPPPEMAPLGALLAEKVLFVTIAVPAKKSVPALAMAPPPKSALLPEKELLVTLRVWKFWMAPPSKPALLPEKVQSVTSTEPLTLEMPAMAPPPPKPALLPEKVLSVTVRRPWLLMAPPPVLPMSSVEGDAPFVMLLLEKMLLVTVRKVPLLMAPPVFWALLSKKVQLLTLAGLSANVAIAPPPAEKEPEVALLPEKVLLVTISGPAFMMPPPPKTDVLRLSVKVLLVTMSLPLNLEMAPPPVEDNPSAMVRFSTSNVTHESTKNAPTALPPLMVVSLPPSMVVFALMVFVLVTVIVAAPPQAKVTVPSKLPPPGRQAFNAASVQLALVPVPTTHAKTDEAAPSTAKTGSAKINANRVELTAAATKVSVAGR